MFANLHNRAHAHVHGLPAPTPDDTCDALPALSLLTAQEDITQRAKRGLPQCAFSQRRTDWPERKEEDMRVGATLR
eukprot:1138002-Pelagomonas_calceolata.AAC.2